VADGADGRALAQLLRSLEEKPAVAALCGPLDVGRALLATLAAGLAPELRAIVVHGGAPDPEALCAQALRALRAAASDEPRVVFEAYLAHLRSRSQGLALLVEAADALPPATLDCLARWARCPGSALRLVAAGRDPTSLVRLLERCGAHRSPIVFARGMREDETREVAEADGERRRASVRPADAPSAPAPVAPRRTRSAWPVRAAGVAAVLALGLLWWRAGNETEPPLSVREIALHGTAPAMERAPASEPGAVDAPASLALQGGVAAFGSDANRQGVESAGSSRPGEREATDPAPASSRALAGALDALEAGDVDAYKRAIRRIDGPAVGQAEAELLRRLDEPPPGARGRARSDRMLVAWGLGLVGSREALPSLDVAAGDADPHVAALAARSAALIRARLATEESAARLP
jgi:hypothetical protein